MAGLFKKIVVVHFRRYKIGGNGIFLSGGIIFWPEKMDCSRNEHCSLMLYRYNKAQPSSPEAMWSLSAHCMARPMYIKAIMDCAVLVQFFFLTPPSFPLPICWSLLQIRVTQ